MTMFAQLGDIVFDPLAGFDTFSETDEAVIAVYGLISGKPLPVQTALGLRQISISMRLHQAFIDVKQARLQLRAHKDQGDSLSLTWGNGEVEGNFLIQAIQMDTEIMDPLGNLYSCHVAVNLLEVPDGFLLTSKQGSSYKKAFAADPKPYPPVVFTPPKPYEPSALQKFTDGVAQAASYAAMIDALSYGGKFPDLGQSLGQIIGNADANMAIMQSLFGDSDFGNDDLNFDIGDISGDITNVRTSLGTLGGIDPVVDPPGFAAANSAFQNFNRIVCF